MRRRWWMSLLLVLALVAGACGGGGDEEVTSGSEGDGEPTEVPKFADGTTMAALQQKGKIVVGTKFDQPLFGLKSATGGNEPAGFDVEIAKLMAQGIFGENIDGKVEYVEAVSKNREPFIQEGKVDMVVATYTINDTRKQVVDFAGPYYVAGQDIMVKKDNTTIKGPDDLAGKKVCSVQGSTPLKTLQTKYPQADASISFDTYSKCAQALTDGRVEAVSTDNVILLGLVEASNGEFKLVGQEFTEEPYGIGIKKGDTAFRDFLNAELEESYSNGKWEKAWKDTAGKVATETPKPPSVNRY